MCMYYGNTPPNPSLVASTQIVKYLHGSSSLRIGDVVSKLFNLSKLSSHFLDQLNFSPFL
jgi:hypothetical protein